MVRKPIFAVRCEGVVTRAFLRIMPGQGGYVCCNVDVTKKWHLAVTRQCYELIAATLRPPGESKRASELLDADRVINWLRGQRVAIRWTAVYLDESTRSEMFWRGYVIGTRDAQA